MFVMVVWFKYVVVKLMSKFYDLKKIPKEVTVKVSTVNRDLKLIRLQQRNYDLQDTILTAIELLKKGNNEKALKILKKVLYEKWFYSY